MVLDISNKTYDLVNHARELQVILPKATEEKQVRLVVCKKGERDQNAVKYYEISTQYLEKSYQARQAELTTQIEQLTQDIAAKEGNVSQLRTQVATLAQEQEALTQSYEAQLENAWTLAEDFARVDLAQANEIYREAFGLFQEGEIEQARALLRGPKRQENVQNIKKRKEEMRLEREKLEEMKSAIELQEERLNAEEDTTQQVIDQEIQNYRLEARLAQLAFDFDSVEVAYQGALALDATNLGVLWDYAYYLNEQNAHARAIGLYSLALDIADTESERSAFMNNLGNLYQDTQELARADTVYQEALSTYRALAQQNPKAYNLDLCMTSLNVCLFYQEALETRKDLMYQSKALNLLKDVATRLNLYTQENPAVSKIWEYHAYLTEYFETYDPNEISENPLVEQLTQLQKALEATHVFSEKVTTQLEIIQLLETVLEADPANTQLPLYLAGQYGSLSWYHLFTQQFPQSEAAARKGLSLDDAAIWINTNLASALLFQDRYEEAEEIYQALKDQPYEGAPGKTYRQIFLEDLAALEEEGVTHPDVEKARGLVGQ